MTLSFRNIDVSPDEPVEQWPFEGVQAALERGGLSQWRRLAAAVRERPWGPVARRIEQALTIDRPYGVAELMDCVIAQSRADAEESERAEVSERIADAIARSGVSRREFAAQVGTSASRLSTYVSGKVSPSAAMLVRIERAGRR